MKDRQHIFTRDGVTYDCLASVMRGKGRVTARQKWFVTVNGVEHPAMQHTRLEFTTPQNRDAFEEAIVALVRNAGDSR